jgi:hypothetical protein
MFLKDTFRELSCDFYMLEAKSEYLIGDRAYDSDQLDEDLKQDGVNMIAPHQSNRKLKTQDGRHIYCVTSAAGLSNGSLPGSSGSGAYSFAGSPTPPTSSVLWNSH